LPESDHADLERRLRIRRRNLERLKQEEKYTSESDTPPAVLDRIQAQVRVESEEIRFLEGQLDELEGRSRQSTASDRGVFRWSPSASSWGRVGLAVLAVGLLLLIVVLIVPRSLEGVALLGPSPTDTLVPTATYTPVLPTATSIPTSTPVPTATYTPTQEAPTPTLVPTSAVPKGTVNVEVLNLRGGPSTEFGIRSKLMSGEELDVLGRNEIGTWLAVSTQDGATGWVAAEYVDITVMVLDLPVKEVEG
jgi:hypothetical protein